MEPIARTAHGQVRGKRLPGGIDAFLGVPFAAPPVGERRFRAPEPVEPWTGVQEATEYGLPALQWTTPEGLFGTVTRSSEDALYLNVWTPHDRDEPLPVMVWTAGGGFYAGASSSPGQTGTTFARDGVVFVSFNYRLGVLGWLNLRDEFPGAAITPGLLDQLAALRWVHENIAAFGGDPGNVTIFGCSAGGISVAALLAMPDARGLFQRAIAQSGGGHHFHRPDEARRIANRFRELIDVAPGDWKRLAAVTGDELLRAQGALFGEVMRRTIDVSGYGVTGLPVVDGEVLPGPPCEALDRGPGHDVDLLVGSNRDEWTLFDHFSLANGLEKSTLQAELDRVGDGQKMLGVYAANRVDATPSDLLVGVETDRWYRMPAIRLAEAHAGGSGSTFMYRFAWPTPAFDGALRACHGLELRVRQLHGSRSVRLDGAGPPRELAAAMHGAWVAFAKDGLPHGAGLPDWPQYEPATRATMQLDLESKVVVDPDGDGRELWAGIL